MHIHLSFLWPYELSYIGWSGSFMQWQQAWIAGGGILVCLIVSGVLQALLLFKVINDWRLSTLFLWVAFWVFINPTGYLIIGGVMPFGDIVSLIQFGVLTQLSSLLVGLIIFFVSFFSLSKIIIIQLTINHLVKNVIELRLSLALFWTTIPILTAMACLGMRLPIHYLQIFMILSFIPLLGAILIPNFLQSRIFSNNSNL